MKRKPCLQLFLVVAVSAVGLPSAAAQRTSSEFARADAELNRLYQQLRTRLSSGQFEQLREAQRAWLAFNEVNERALPQKNPQALRTEETQARCEQLRFLLERSSGPRDEALLRAADAELNTAYQEVLASLPSPEQKQLRQAQRAWVTFYVASQHDAPTVAAMIARRRTQQLREAYPGEETPGESFSSMSARDDEPEPPVDPTTPDPFERARRPQQ